MSIHLYIHSMEGTCILSLGMKPVWQLGGQQKVDLQLVCGRLTSRHSRRGRTEQKEELSESLSNNDFYKISKGEFILCKINAKL